MAAQTTQAALAAMAKSLQEMDKMLKQILEKVSAKAK